MIAFYLDEHLPLRTAAIGRQAGLDIVAVRERNTRGWPDDVQLHLATEEGRVLVTRNYPDFAALARTEAEDYEEHLGIIMVPPSIEQDDAVSVVRGLQVIERLYPEGLAPGAVLWLPRP